MSELTIVSDDTMECPLCLGKGQLKRIDALRSLGMTDQDKIARLGAEEAFRLLLNKHKEDHGEMWRRFESEMENRSKEISEGYKAKIKELEDELSGLGRSGRRGELEFAAEARTWKNFDVSDKLGKHGDYILTYKDRKDRSGVARETRMVVDNKDKTAIKDEDIEKLVRDVKERALQVGIVVTKDEEQLRQIDKDNRWAFRDGVWILRTTRQWLPRDLAVLKPILDRMRTEGTDFLQRNVALAEEVRRSLAEMDGIEKELKKATTAIESASDLVTKYRARLADLCESSCAQGSSAGSVTSISDEYAAIGA